MNGGITLMDEQRTDRSGQTLGPYQLTRLLGAGGFGEVYEADHRLLQQKCAIKLLLERHFHDSNQRARFLREARTQAMLDHPNILPLLEVGEEDTILYLVMPFYHRGTLNDFLRQRTVPLPPAEVERVLLQICAALGYAHTRNIAHLDLKPDNILLHEDGRLILSDFGLAHLIKQGRMEAGSSAAWGTPHYMAPEQIRREPGLRSDLYALGIILYQLLTNQRPSTGTTPEAIMMKHLLETPLPLHVANPQAPATLEPVLRKALQKKPEDRYATAAALLADFQEAVSGPVRPPTPRVSSSPTPQTNDPASIVQMASSVLPERELHAAEPAKAMAAVCQVDHCGVLAIGRCSFCKHSFCTSHQARDRDGTCYVDVCVPCYPKTEKGRAEQASREEAEAYLYFTSGTARTDLLAARVPPVEIYRVLVLEQRVPTKKGILRQYHIDRVKKITFSGRGWILGEFRWAYTVGYGNPSNRVPEVAGIEKWLIALLDLSPDAIVSHYASWNSTLVQVRPCSGGYEHSNSGYEWPDPYNPSCERFGGSWRVAAQAVKRLIRTSPNNIYF
jgi:serine/threonine protein kinase